MRPFFINPSNGFYLLRHENDNKRMSWSFSINFYLCCLRSLALSILYKKGSRTPRNSAVFDRRGVSLNNTANILKTHHKGNACSFNAFKKSPTSLFTTNNLVDRRISPPTPAAPSTKCGCFSIWAVPIKGNKPRTIFRNHIRQELNITSFGRLWPAYWNVLCSGTARTT